MEAESTKQLEKHLQEAIALEQSVLRMLDAVAKTSQAPGFQQAAEEHMETTRAHVERLQRRLKEYGSSPSRKRQLAGVVVARAKGVLDLARREKPGRNARDAFVAEQTEVAAYELLERIATRAGDDATAAVARQNRAEDEAMAQRIAGQWDMVAELSLATNGGQQASEGKAKQAARKTKQAATKASSLVRNPVVLGAASVAAGVLINKRSQASGQGEGPPASAPDDGGIAASGLEERTPNALERLTKAQLHEKAAAAGVTVSPRMTKQELIGALRQPAPRGRNVNPVELQTFLKGMGYPARKADLLRHAHAHGADEDVRSILERLPDREYDGPAGVSEEVGKLE